MVQAVVWSIVFRIRLRSRIFRKHDLEIEEICCATERFFIKDDTKITSRIIKLIDFSPFRLYSCWYYYRWIQLHWSQSTHSFIVTPRAGVTTCCSLSTIWDTSTSLLIAAILDFPLSVRWTIILSSFVVMLHPEYIGLAVEIAFLCCLGPSYNLESLGVFTHQVSGFLRRKIKHTGWWQSSEQNFNNIMCFLNYPVLDAEGQQHWLEWGRTKPEVQNPRWRPPGNINISAFK